MTPAQVEKALAKLQARCEKELDDLCEDIRRKYVIPFCDKHGYQFTSGMGSWDFRRYDKVEGPRSQIGSWNSELLPKRLEKLLRMGYFTNRNDLGSMMRDYTPKGFKERS